MEHYFSESPESGHRLRSIECSFFGRDFYFLTDASIFSRKRVDYGTSLLIESATIEKKDRLLDLGCGYGVVGIALSFLCRRVVMVDINSRACELATFNMRKNRVRNAKVVCGSLEDLHERFDAILFNPPIRAGKKAYLPLIEKARDFLNGGGRIYVVARTTQGAKSIFRFMDGIYKTEYASKKAGYRVMLGKV